MSWTGRSKQFIEKWKRAAAHVFFDWNGHIFFLAGDALSKRMNGGLPLRKGEFALCAINQEQFVKAVLWTD